MAAEVRSGHQSRRRVSGHFLRCGDAGMEGHVPLYSPGLGRSLGQSCCSVRRGAGGHPETAPLGKCASHRCAVSRPRSA